MTPLETEGGAPDPPPRRPRFSAALTALLTIVVVVYVVLPLGLLFSDSESPLSQMERPEDSLNRLVTRELDLRAAMLRGSPWEWRLYRALSGGDDPVEEATGWYEELLDEAPSSPAALHHAILAAEAGRPEPVGDAITRWPAGAPPADQAGDWLRAAYEDPPADPAAGRALIASIRAGLPPSWFADTLVARIATRIGDDEARAQAEAALVARGRALQWRLRLLIALVASLVVAAAGAAVVIWRQGARVSDAALPPRWSTADGYALFVRGLGVPHTIVLGLVLLLHDAAAPSTPLAMAADLPLFWWVARYLRARGDTWGGTFGLGPDRRGRPRLVSVTLLLIGVALLGDAVIEAAGNLVGLGSHWADGFAEELLWDTPGQLMMDAFNVVVWAPAVEEVLFRGLLYGTLRTRLAVLPAALLSAVLFALPHGYGAVGSASVLMSGVLWALTYERTRSLLPGLLAHSANNLMSTLWAVALLR